jgi:hypothetical protein
MVLHKGSATLGYPDEISEPINADHHHVCKYPNKNDMGYKSMRSVLKTLVSAYREEGIPYLFYAVLSLANATRTQGSKSKRHCSKKRCNGSPRS